MFCNFVAFALKKKRLTFVSKSDGFFFSVMTFFYFEFKFVTKKMLPWILKKRILPIQKRLCRKFPLDSILVYLCNIFSNCNQSSSFTDIIKTSIIQCKSVQMVFNNNINTCKSILSIVSSHLTYSLRFCFFFGVVTVQT